MWDGRLNSPKTDKNGSLCCWHTLGSEGGEIGRLEKSRIKFDEDSQSYYFLIAEGGQGKSENATRQVVIHLKLIEWGFMEYVDSQWKERIFSEVAGYKFII